MAAMAAPDAPGLLAALAGGRGALAGVGGPVGAGGIGGRQPGDLRASARRHGFRPAQVRRLFMVRELARRWHVPADSAAPVVTCPREALLQSQELRSSLKECFSVLYLNTRNQPVGCEKVAVGGLNVAALQPREVFGPALTLGAAAGILAPKPRPGARRPWPSPATSRRLAGYSEWKSLITWWSALSASAACASRVPSDVI